MKVKHDGVMVLPSSYVAIDNDEMMCIEGGSFVSQLLVKIGKFLASHLASKGLDYVWKNRKKLWKQFLKGLEPTNATKATPYYQTFSNSIRR